MVMAARHEEHILLRYVAVLVRYCTWRDRARLRQIRPPFLRPLVPLAFSLRHLLLCHRICFDFWL